MCRRGGRRIRILEQEKAYKRIGDRIIRVWICVCSRTLRIVAMNLDDGGIAQIIHVDGGGRKQHGLCTRSPSRAPETWLSAARGSCRRFDCCCRASA
jgi:hypothetical protein